MMQVARKVTSHETALRVDNPAAMVAAVALAVAGVPAAAVAAVVVKVASS